MNNHDIEIGNRIRFRAWNRHENREVVRVVNGFYDAAKTIPTVRYLGWSRFVVAQREISEVIK